MQLTNTFRVATASIGFLATLVTATTASSASLAEQLPIGSSLTGADKTIGGSMPAASSQVVYATRADIMRLVANMDPSELTIIGNWPPADNPLSPDSADDMTVVYCSTVDGQECNPPCTLYNGGGPTCLAAPSTKCLLATFDVGFCSTPDCSNSVPGICTNFTGYCATHTIDDGYCYTPDTNSIIVPSPVSNPSVLG
ncbi:hypothetical protein C8Q73DRAFT_268492 [Cubamyces lactineus]|nr:hypothetical protein C8Q73DRAFT_268492 [Cubamyces lactineus]